MSRRRKKHDHDEHIDESWLIPYADLLTLLLALFIVLYSMSSIDAKRFQALSEVFNEVFTKGTGILEYPNPINQDDAVTFEEKEDQEETEEEYDLESDMLELKGIQEKIDAYIAEKELDEMLETTLTDEGLLLLIRDNVLFRSGSDRVRNEDLVIAREISNLLEINPPRNIIISGHTDNVPINNSQFASNWELSVMRAVNFMKIVIENDNLDPRWFSAKGFGEYYPVATNSTEQGRAQNRRVEILILPRNKGDGTVVSID
ncbi:flagellar motor protein MotB [Sutcliffiella rhizosphaerae]|uniref:Motility protein B n=1 Tax=Sutcliffiella rhizosphaerae TaxID=2880967 RepID=A0ABN8A8W0_9BACI|nr:flagellar motor protein MotB [Sutcliffiella rhizosphaerae]CAG9621139.1 Motility protein B [Sutcliffiella rhizosphaerae]